MEEPQIIQTSYFEQRIYGELGLTPEQITVQLGWPAVHELTSWYQSAIRDRKFTFSGTQYHSHVAKSASCKISRNCI